MKDDHTLSQRSILRDNALHSTLRLKGGMTSTLEEERHDKRKASESTDGETLKERNLAQRFGEIIGTVSCRDGKSVETGS